MEYLSNNAFYTININLQSKPTVFSQSDLSIKLNYNPQYFMREYW